MVVGKTEGVNYNPLENVTIIYSWEVFLHLGSLMLSFPEFSPIILLIFNFLWIDQSRRKFNEKRKKVVCSNYSTPWGQ